MCCLRLCCLKSRFHTMTTFCGFWKPPFSFSSLWSGKQVALNRCSPRCKFLGHGLAVFFPSVRTRFLPSTPPLYDVQSNRSVCRRIEPSSEATLFLRCLQYKFQNIWPTKVPKLLATPFPAVPVPFWHARRLAQLVSRLHMAGLVERFVFDRPASPLGRDRALHLQLFRPGGDVTTHILPLQSFEGLLGRWCAKILIGMPSPVVLHLIPHGARLPADCTA